MSSVPPRPPDDLPLPPLPDALHAWFAFVAGLPDDVELHWDGRILDGLRVVDETGVRRALEGYRYVVDDGRFVDAASRGGWEEHWIVLDSMSADPLIADVGDPGVPVLEALHGEGSWNPEPVAASLQVFIDGLEIVTDVPAPPWEPEPADWETVLTSLGDDPARTRIRLRAWPLFPERSYEALIRIGERLPLVVTRDVTEHVARNTVAWARGAGIPLDARRRTDHCGSGRDST